MTAAERVAAMSDGLPPEPGFARREAKRQKEKRNEEEGGIWGKHGFPLRASARAALGRAAQSGEGGIRTLEAGIFPT